MIFIFFPASSLSSLTGEVNYCKAVCKYFVPELTDADFDPRSLTDIYNTGFDGNIQHVLNRGNNKDIVIIPTTGIQTRINVEGWKWYPNLQIAIPLAKDSLTVTGANLPEEFALTPNRQPMVIVAGGGNAGLCEWYNGVALEFVEPAGGMYLSGSTLVQSFTITNVTSPGGGVARIFATEFANIGFTGAKWKIHISGVAGFSNNPNGTFNITAINTTSGYIDITHPVGTGSWTSATGTAIINYLSGSVAAIGAKIYYIAKQRNCSIYEARICARATGSQSGLRDDTHGYGSINTTNAIAYAGTIPQDALDTIGAVGLLAVNLSGGKATFTHPEIVNARSIRLYRDNEILFDKTMNYGQSYSFEHYPVKLKSRAYHIKGYRDKQSTTNSNSVFTNIASLQGLPTEIDFSEGDSVWYLRGESLVSSTVQKVLDVSVTNPNYDNQGVQTNLYKLANGDVIKEIQGGAKKLFFTRNHLAWEKRNRERINTFAISTIDPFLFSDTDICGFDFTLTDFTALGDFDFTGAYVIGCNLTGATLPTAFANKQDFKAAVARYEHCIWTDGLPI